MAVAVRDLLGVLAPHRRHSESPVLTPEKKARADAISTLIRLGWSPPPPSDAITQRILDDMERLTHKDASLELAPREAQVIRLVAEGNTTKEIARELELSPLTIEEYQKRVRRRLGARSMAHAVALWKDAA